ncbi:MAG: GntR family transcriptional regulator [Nocardioides sp.]
MDPRPTVVSAPMQLQVADDIRMKIQRGDLKPGDSLPTLGELMEQWSCSMNTARGGIALLKAQGLITAGRGRAPIVRIPPPRVIRSSERHQLEKDQARLPEPDRGAVGEAETNHYMPLHDQEFSSEYDQVEAGDEISAALQIAPTDAVLRRSYDARHRRTGQYLSTSVSYIPLGLISSNPSLLDARNEPWPGGTIHQLSTVGIEIASVIDEVTARMPTTVETQMWNLPDGVPLIFCRRISINTHGHPVEISDALYPADRTELRFVTPLQPWT